MRAPTSALALALALALASTLASTPFGSLAPAARPADVGVAAAPGPWPATALAPATAGVEGARWPGLAANGTRAVFRHDGDVASGGPPTNPRGRPQVFTWRAGRVAQITDTSNEPAGATALARPSVSADGERVAFEARGDLAGGNPEHAGEAFLWSAAGGLRQLSDGGPGTAASMTALARSGEVAALWHTGDLAGANPGGVPQLFLAREGAAPAQLTDLAAAAYVGEVAAAGGAAAPVVAFITDADLVGENADGSWELFLWRGPPGAPGDPARFSQLTDWRPPMTGREIYHPTLSADGTVVAFAGKGHVDIRQPAGHVPAEVYVWRAATGPTRLTTATSPRASSWLPRLSDDGAAVAFVSLADLAPAPSGPGNADGSAEVFVAASDGSGEWAQVTASTARPGILAAEPALGLGLDAVGDAVAFVAERLDDPAPLALPSRRGIPFLAARPGAPAPASTAPPTAPPAATAPTVPTPTPAGVCPQVAARLPAAVVADALGNPARYEGWLAPRNAALPPGPANPLRTWLSLRDLGKPFDRFNGALWRAGCP